MRDDFRVGSTFSGVGGIDLGLERAGMRVAWQAESDEWCRSVLAHRFPGVPCYHDVRSVDAAAARVDLLCGGFPCQDVSFAGGARTGGRIGLAGARSGLFHEFARIAAALRPAWLLIENVPGLLSSNDGRDFGVVVGTLAELGYGVAWRVLDSRYFGVPQRRRRVFITGRLGDDGSRALRALCESCPGSPPTSRSSWQDAAAGTQGSAESSVGGVNMAPTLKSRASERLGGNYGPEMPLVVNALDRQAGGPDDNAAQANHLVTVSPALTAHHRRDAGADTETYIAFHATQDPISGSVVPAMGHEPNAIASTRGVRRLTPRECERLQAFPDDWTLIPGTRCPDTRRYAAIGNAVTVNVAHWIGDRIMSVDAELSA